MTLQSRPRRFRGGVVDGIRRRDSSRRRFDAIEDFAIQQIVNRASHVSPRVRNSDSGDETDERRYEGRGQRFQRLAIFADSELDGAQPLLVGRDVVESRAISTNSFQCRHQPPNLTKPRQIPPLVRGVADRKRLFAKQIVNYTVQGTLYTMFVQTKHRILDVWAFVRRHCQIPTFFIRYRVVQQSHHIANSDQPYETFGLMQNATNVPIVTVAKHIESASLPEATVLGRAFRDETRPHRLDLFRIYSNMGGFAIGYVDQ